MKLKIYDPLTSDETDIVEGRNVILADDAGLTIEMSVTDDGLHIGGDVPLVIRLESADAIIIRLAKDE